MTAIYSQRIKGVILDAESNNPIKDVHIFINEKSVTTTSNFNGKFRINVNNSLSGKDTIHITHIGYESKKIPLIKNDLLIYLEPNSNKLTEVNLVSRKFKSELIYNRLSPMKNRLYSFGSILKGDKIYVFGGNSSYGINNFRKVAENNPDLDFKDFLKKAGLNPNYSLSVFNGDMQVYDIKTDTWRKDTLKLRKRANHSVVANNNKIYVLGGTRVSKNGKFEYLEDKIEVLDINNNSVKVDYTNPHQAVNFSSFSYKDNLILIGGSNKKKKSGKKLFSNKVHIYNTKSGLWYKLADMPVAKEVKGVLISDKVYLFGGYNNKPLKDIESYNLLTGKWRKEGELTIPMEKPAITYKDNMVYLYEKGKVLTYDTESKELAEYSINLSVKDANLHVADNKLYLLGGLKENSYSYLPSSDVIRINLKEFDRTRIKQSKRF